MMKQINNVLIMQQITYIRKYMKLSGNNSEIIYGIIELINAMMIHLNKTE